MNRLVVLRVDNFPGSGDPVFGTKHELRRSFRAPDLFARLTSSFRGSPGTPCLKKVTLQGCKALCNSMFSVWSFRLGPWQKSAHPNLLRFEDTRHGRITLKPPLQCPKSSNY